MDIRGYFGGVAKKVFTPKKGVKEGEFSILKGESNGSEQTMYFDGGAVPNPGKAAGAAIIGKKTAVKKLAHATNNQAEYTGLIVGLTMALENDIKRLYIMGDSKLVISQIEGVWKVDNMDLKKMHAEAYELLAKFDFVATKWIPREQNSGADALAARAISSPA
jgi:ribonuclease HI